MRIPLAVLIGFIVSLALVVPVQASAPRAGRKLPTPLEQQCSCVAAPYCSTCVAIYPTKGGTYICCPVKQEVDGSLRTPTLDEMEDLQTQIRDLENSLPPGPERDRAFAAILEQGGFVYDQAEILREVTLQQSYIDPAEVIQIQNLYAQVNMPEAAVAYAEAVNARMPVFVIGTANPIYIDIFAANRAAIFEHTATIAAEFGLTADAATFEAQATDLQLEIDNFDLIDALNTLIGGAP